MTPTTMSAPEGVDVAASTPDQEPSSSDDSVESGAGEPDDPAEEAPDLSRDEFYEEEPEFLDGDEDLGDESLD